MPRIRWIYLAAALAAAATSAAAEPADTFGPGTHTIGTDIRPGLYRTKDEVTYFARLSGLSGESGDIIANEASADGPVLVEIKDADVAFESSGPGERLLVDDSYQPEVKTTFSAGWWLVGLDIEPGLYRAEGDIRYLARLSGLGGEIDDIIPIQVSLDGPAVVEIKPDDVAFQSRGEGEWRLVDESYQPEPRTTFGDGFWIVGVDILPGEYRTDDDVRYYARLPGLAAKPGTSSTSRFL